MNTKKFIIFALLILGLVMILILTALLVFSSNNSKKNKSVNQSLTIGSNAIYIAEQVPGYNVSVQVVNLKKAGFVAIHEDSNGSPGGILGVSNLLAPGETKNLPPIALHRATKNGEIIYAMLHVDNGDGKFDSVDDKPPLDPTGGEPVMMSVIVSEDATEPGAVNY